MYPLLPLGGHDTRACSHHHAVLPRVLMAPRCAECACEHQRLGCSHQDVVQKKLQGIMERYGTTEIELEEQHIEEILDVISSEVGLAHARLPDCLLLARSYRQHCAGCNNGRPL
jgi:hypothetical protein